MGLALLGASASGKTSLSKAMVGIWPAQHGVVRLDGAALDQWRNEDLGRYIGYLPQDVALFDGSVAENICRFDEHATSDAILKAAQIAGVHDIILRLPEGYSTRIGEGGMSLSAGQRQRIGLARAVFGDPFMVVLDEPNANLDTDGENALTRAIQILRHNKCIVIVVSHRPSALAALDTAMVLYEGKGIAFGSCQEIFARVRTAKGRVCAGETTCGGSECEYGSPGSARRERCVMRPGGSAGQASRSVPATLGRRAAGRRGWAAGRRADSSSWSTCGRRSSVNSRTSRTRRTPNKHVAPRAAVCGQPQVRNSRQPKHQRKGKMARAIDVCLEQFGFTTAPPAPRRSEHARAPEAGPPLRRPDITASGSPIPMDVMQLGREIPGLNNKSQPTIADTPRTIYPRSTGNVKPRTAIGQASIEGRVGLIAGVAFLINRESLADNDNAPGESLTSRAGRSFEDELRTGFRVLLCAGVMAGGWSVLMPLAGAVVVPGNLVVQSNVKTIQHPTGGVVAEIAVHNGQRVGTGDLLLRLDATQAQASLQMVSKQLDEVRARIARLVAERDSLPRLVVPAELAARSGDGIVDTLLMSEASLFKARAMRVEARPTSCKTGSRSSARKSAASMPRSGPRQSNCS